MESMAAVLAALPSDEELMAAIERHDGSDISVGGGLISTTGASASNPIGPTPSDSTGASASNPIGPTPSDSTSFLANAVIQDEDDDVLRLVDTADLPVAEGAGVEAEVHDPAAYAEAVVADHRRRAELSELFAPKLHLGSGGSVTTAAGVVVSDLDPNAKEFFPTWMIRGKVLGDPTYLHPAMSPRSSKQVADLLKAGDEEVRGLVLAGVTPNARLFMETLEGGEVFVALVGLPEVRLGDLENIINAALGGPQQFDNPDWVTSLEALITAVAQRGPPYLRMRVLRYLQDDGVMNRAGGGQVLAHCLATMPYQEAKVLIRHALDTINDKLESEFGSRCLAVCFRNARADELQDFMKVICEGAIEHGQGPIQEVMEHGYGGIQYAVVGELMKDVASLSLHQYGHCVLESCFIKTGESRGELLRRLLEAFVRLPNEQLAQMAQVANSSRVLSMLFDTARALIPEDKRARALALKIRAKRAVLPENAHTRLVMESMDELLSTGR